MMTESCPASEELASELAASMLTSAAPSARSSGESPPASGGGSTHTPSMHFPKQGTDSHLTNPSPLQDCIKELKPSPASFSTQVFTPTGVPAATYEHAPFPSQKPSWPQGRGVSLSHRCVSPPLTCDLT